VELLVLKSSRMRLKMAGYLAQGLCPGRENKIWRSQSCATATTLNFSDPARSQRRDDDTPNLKLPDIILII
jgi:hypothetical protein